MSYQTKFIDVGRNKRSWSFTTPHKPGAAELERCVRKSGALMSSDIEVFFEGNNSAQVVVGSFRAVGRIEIMEFPTVQA